jgi:hypothetical protein
MIVTITWNQLGFHFLDCLPKGRTFNGERYRDNIFSPLLLPRPQADGRKLMIHADNTIPARLANAQLSVPKIPYNSPRISRIHLISHSLTAFSSGMSSTACRERFLGHAKRITCRN